MEKQHRWMIILALIIILVSIIGEVGANAQRIETSALPISTQNDADKQKIEQAALTQVSKYPELLAQDYGPFQVGMVRIEGSWAFLNLLSFPLETEQEVDLVVPNIILAIAHKSERGDWEVYLETMDNYRRMLPEIPDTLLSNKSKRSLLSAPSLFTGTSQPTTAHTLPGLPWAVGTAWRYNQGPHSGALDFGTPQIGVSDSVYAADSGVVTQAYETCIAVRRSSDNLTLLYQHIRSSDIAEWSVGDYVSIHQWIGMTTTDPGCGGTSTGHHLHFFFDIGQGSSMDGWVLVGTELHKDGVVARPNMADTVLYSRCPPEVYNGAELDGNIDVAGEMCEAFLRNGGFGNGGVGYVNYGAPAGGIVHNWAQTQVTDPHDYQIQDFIGGSNDPDGATLIYNPYIEETGFFGPGVVRAFFVRGQILWPYLDLGEWDVSNGVRSWLQGPISDLGVTPQEYIHFESGNEIGYFERGFIANSLSQGFSAHTYYPSICNAQIQISEENDTVNLYATTDAYRAPGYPNADDESDPFDVYFVIVKEDGTRVWQQMNADSLTLFSITWNNDELPLTVGENVWFYIDAYNRRHGDYSKYSSYPKEVVWQPQHFDDGSHYWDGSKEYLKPLTITVTQEPLQYPNDNWLCPGGEETSPGDNTCSLQVTSEIDADVVFVPALDRYVLGHAKVSLMKNGREVASGFTDDEGNVLLSHAHSTCLVDGYSLRIYLSSRIDASDDTIVFHIRNGDSTADDSNIPYVESETFSLSSDGGDVSVSIRIGTGGNVGTNVPEDRIEPLTMMYVHSRETIDFILHNLPASPLDLKYPVQVSGYSEKSTAASLGEGRIWIADSDSDTFDNDAPMNREWHEMSHRIQIDIPGASTVWEEDDNHRGTGNDNTADSWLEGWAEFWPLVINDTTPGYFEPHIYRWSGGATNMESNIYAYDTIWGTSIEELAVASLLWDLYDGTGKEYVKWGTWPFQNTLEFEDNIQLSIDQLWSVIGTQQLDTMHDVYEAFKTAPDMPYSEDDLNTIFILHGFFEDKNRNRELDDDERVGFTWVDGESRESTPTVPKANLIIEILDTEGQPTSGTLVVEVVDDPPMDIYNYSYERHILEFGQMLSFEIPSPALAKTVRMWAEVEGQASGVLEIDVVDYWRAVANAKNGYIVDYLHNQMAEYTFTLGDLAPIPFDFTPPQALLMQGAIHGNEGWLLTDPVSLTLTSVDDLVGTATTEFSFDTTEWFTYTEPFTATHGDAIYYRATDWLGNVEPTQQITIQIDTIAPTSTLSLSPALSFSETFTIDAHVFFSGADGGPSGLDYVEYRLNGGAWLDYDPETPLVITQNGVNILEYRAVDVAGNVEPTQAITITIDKTTYTIVPLDGSQTNLQMATQAVVNAMLDSQLPLLATAPFTITPSLTATVYPTGTVIVQGEVEGDFSKQVHVGPLDLPPAWALYPQTVALFESASLDERASWELPDLRRALETYLWLHEWPIVNETDIASDTVPADVTFFPAGVTPDVLIQFQEVGAAAALLDQAAQGRWFVFQGDAARLAERAGLVPTGTVETNALEPGVSALTPVRLDSILAYNWPEDMALTRYSDAPRLYLTDPSISRIANYADNGEAAIITRRIGSGGVILIGGHASLDQISYVLLYNAWFAAAAEQVGSHVSVEQQFMPGTPPDTVPGFEADVPVLISTIFANYGDHLIRDFAYTEMITGGYRLIAPPTVSRGTVFTTPLITGTLVTWTDSEFLPGERELQLLVANIATDTIKPGDVVASEANFSYSETNAEGVMMTKQLSRPDAIVRALPPALLTHNPTDEPDNIYPLPSEGVYIHIRHDLENKLETRSNNTFYTVTVPLIGIVQDAFDQTVLPTITHYGWYRPIVITDVEETHAFIKNTIMGYPNRNYLPPVGSDGANWSYDLADWDGHTRVRIPNPHHIFVHIPIEYREFITQEPGNGDLLVPGKVLVFDLGTLLPYDLKEPAIRYLVHSQELFERGISFSVEPITDTLVLKGNGGSVYTAVGQHPVPFREYLDDAAINNPIVPVPSQIIYTDLWGRPHVVTETVRSSFYDIIPYARTGDAVDVNFVSTYGLNDPDGHQLFDWPTYQVVTLTVAIRAESVNRALSEGQMLIQEMLPRGLGYDIEFIDWEASHDSFQLVDEYVARFPAFDLLYFQGTLPENEPQTITITARLRVYDGHPHEGSTLVDGGATIASLNEWGNPSQYDTSMTHVRVEQGYESSLGLEKWILSPDISRHGGPTYEIIRLDGSADVERFTEEVYIDSTGTINETAVVRVGGSRGPNLYFGTVQAGGKTMLVMEVINSSGQDWHGVDLSYSAPAGFSLSPILTDGLEPPPNVFDTPYLWAEDIPDMTRGVYYYEVQVDESVLPGVMYPIVFTLNGENVPDAAEFPLPVARIGVGGDVQRTLGQAHDILLYDSSPTYAEPLVAKGMTGAQLSTLKTLTDTDEIDAFFEALTLTVPVTSHVPLSSTTRLISYTISAGWQTLPLQVGSEILPDRYLMVDTQVEPVEPGNRLINDGPQADYQDDFGQAWTVLGNPTHAIAHGPALTGTYSIHSVTSPFYGGQVIDPIPGEEVDVCTDIAVRNIGNYVATEPVISTTINLTSGVEIIKVVPTPTSVISGVITWGRPAILPYGASENPEADVDHLRVCLRFTPTDPQILLAMLYDLPFYVPLLEGTQARYMDEWGEQPFTIRASLGGEFGLHVGGDPLPAPDLYNVTLRDEGVVRLNWTAVPGARDYVVYRSTRRDRDFGPVGTVTDGTEFTDIIWDNPLAPLYFYVVRARDANQVEGRHSQVQVVQVGDWPFNVYLPLVLK